MKNSFYNKLPTFVQELALNLYGFRTIYRRYLWVKYLQKFADSEFWPVYKQIDYVSQKLRFILAHAIETVPKYKSLKTLVSDIKNPQKDIFQILLEFPVITKSEILEDYSLFLSSRPLTKKIIVTKTSGTTGTPFKVFMNAEVFHIVDAFAWRRNIWAKYEKGDWIARLVGDPIISLKEKNPKRPYRISFVDKRIYLSTYHLKRETANIYLRLLEQKKPQFLMGYPSALHILGAYALEMKFTPDWTPKAILYSSEPLYEHQREVISKVFRALPRGFYGSAERVISAAECEHGQYHLSLIDGYIEGQFGILPNRQPALVTSLLNTVMPLIRFELGDMLNTLPNQKCTCGRTLPLIEPVVTKKEDYIETPSGRRISSSIITWAFKDLYGIRRSQLVQVDAESVEIYVDTDPHLFPEIQKKLKDRLNDMFFGEMKLKVILNNNIGITEAGKTRFVVRLR